MRCTFCFLASLLLACSGSLPAPDAGGDAAVADSTPTVDTAQPPDTGGGDVAPPADGPVADAGQAITAPEKTWTWVPFPGARCADNSPTGIGVNIIKASSKLLIYLKGGGACWDHDTCNKKPILSVDLDGFDKKKFAALKWHKNGVFDRASKTNPLASWSHVFVPYCTGDFHGGVQYSKVTGKHHVGHLNVAKYLARLRATFPKVTQVLLAGSSAGGFGTLMNYHQVQAAFAGVPVDLLDDSGPMLDEAYLKPKLQGQMYSAWGLAKSMPPGCAKCKTGHLDDLVAYLAGAHPKRRFGLISSREDAVIRAYFAHGYTPKKLIMPAADFRKGLDHLADTVMAPHKNWSVYYTNASWHVYVAGATLAVTSVGGTKLRDWISDMVTGKAGWTSVRPKL